VSCVSSEVRHVWVSLALVLASAQAGADGHYVPVASHSISLGFSGHGTHIDGASETGGGPTLELALGVGRWQPFVEGMISTAGVGSWTMPAVDDRVDGWMGRGGLGLRWIARQFRPDPSGAIELYLQAIAGVEKFWWHDGTRLTRPDVGVGFGTQIRVFPFHGFTTRIDVRLLFTPTDRESAWVSCRGTCTAATNDGSAAGFMTGMQFGW